MDEVLVPVEPKQDLCLDSNASFPLVPVQLVFQRSSGRSQRLNGRHAPDQLVAVSLHH